MRTMSILTKSAVGIALAASVVVAPLSYATKSTLPNGSANNEINQANICNLKVGILIDRSNSIRNDSENNPKYIRDAVGDVATSLQGTDTKVAVWSFGTKATGYQGKNIIIGDNGNDADKEAAPIKLSDYPGVGFTSMKDASGVTSIKNTVASIPFSTDRLEAANSSLAEREVGWTNWEAALAESTVSGSTPSQSDIVLMITDGTPTVPRDFTAEPTTDPLEKNQIAQQAVISGVAASEKVKSSAAGTRIVAIGVGDVTKTDDGVDNLKRISGGLTTAVEGDDYYLSADFAHLGSTLNEAIKQACDEKPAPTPTPTPAPTAPEKEEKVVELPKTGPADAIVSMTGISLLAFALTGYIRSRIL